MPRNEDFLIRFGPGAFSGITLGRWLRVLRENRFAVDPPYWGRAAMITLGSISNSILAWCENVTYSAQVKGAKVAPPIFILGYWRSGTTLLHNLLTQDERFAYPNNFQVFWPLTFLVTEKRNAPLMGSMMPKKRPQDNMTIGIQEPQEDEFALCSMTGRNVSMSWAFPRRVDHYDRFLTFREASERERAEWKSALTLLIQKLAFKYGKPLILKSPGHTCRIKPLLELFPDAKFVHIHRNPYDVFQSAVHTIKKVTPWWTLQRLDHSELEERTIRQYKQVYDVFFEERALIPRGRLHEVCFETLEADPVGQVRDLYHALDLPDFQAAAPALERYVASLTDYKKNAFPELPDELRQRIAREWRRSFEEWGYAT
jgi:omega-hydroxy-beta-dihydromenaquinone-9 sulfotransferase